MSPLDPCPACASTLGPFSARIDGRDQIICSTCGARGPYADATATAAQKWASLPRNAPPPGPDQRAHAAWRADLDAAIEKVAKVAARDPNRPAGKSGATLSVRLHWPQ